MYMFVKYLFHITLIIFFISSQAVVHAHSLGLLHAEEHLQAASFVHEHHHPQAFDPELLEDDEGSGVSHATHGYHTVSHHSDEGHDHGLHVHLGDELFRRSPGNISPVLVPVIIRTLDLTWSEECGGCVPFRAEQPSKLQLTDFIFHFTNSSPPVC